MFRQLKNIDSAFKHVKWFSIALLLATVIISLYTIYNANQTVSRQQRIVYVIAGDKLLEAVATERAAQLPIEIKGHLKSFHNLFFNLEPDDGFIKKNISKALYLADLSAKQEYDNLQESGYYSDIISGNISQRVLDPDSIIINTTSEPYYFRYYGRLRITRATSIVTRSIVTEGIVRMSKVSDNNEHGMLIERWKILANKDLSIEKR